MTVKSKRSAEDKRKRNERERAERTDDRGPLHMYVDIGTPIAVADYKPISVQKDPEEHLTAIFARLDHDYGGVISPRSEEPR